MFERVTIVGKGNVSFFYQKTMEKKGLKVRIVSSYGPFLCSDFQDADLVVLAVKDDVIEKVTDALLSALAGKLKKETLLVHTSGYKSTEILAKLADNYGSLYPLQTLRKEVETDFDKVCLCTWANNEETRQELRIFSLRLSPLNRELDDKQRQSLHLAAVFANNFSNDMYAIAKEILDKDNLPFSLLLPLIEHGVEAVREKEPLLCQTGPAVRGDKGVTEEHKKRLEGRVKQIYELISQDIAQRKINK